MLRQIAHLCKEGQLAGAVFMAVAQKAVALPAPEVGVAEPGQLAVRMAAVAVVAAAHLIQHQQHHLVAQAHRA
jgi:hypothetical protein